MPKIILFEDTNFNGKHLVIKADVRQLSKSNPNFQDITSSVIVIRGKWTLYEDAHFAGTQWHLTENGGPDGDGCYPHPKDWNGKSDVVSSVQKG